MNILSFTRGHGFGHLLVQASAPAACFSHRFSAWTMECLPLFSPGPSAGSPPAGRRSTPPGASGSSPASRGRWGRARRLRREREYHYLTTNTTNCVWWGAWPRRELHGTVLKHDLCPKRIVLFTWQNRCVGESHQLHIRWTWDGEILLFFFFLLPLFLLLIFRELCSWSGLQTQIQQNQGVWNIPQ